jgi:oligosaccharide repeat unit polymerase
MQLFYFIETIMLLGFCTALGYIKAGKIFNPITLFNISLIFPVFSIYICDQLDLLREFAIKDANNTLTLYNIATICFILPWMRTNIRINNESIINEKKTYSKIPIRICFIIIIWLVIASFIIGGTPIISMITGKMNVTEYNSILQRFPPGFLTIGLVCSIALYLYISSILTKRRFYQFSKRKILFVLFICLIASIWQGKRQGLLMLIFFIIARKSFDFYKISSFKKIIFIATIIGSFIVFMFLFNLISKIRMQENQTNSNELITYAMYSPMNLALIANIYSPYGSTIIPNKILSEIIPNRYIQQKDSEINLFESSAPSGYFANWYMDYGYIGVVIGALLLSLVSKKLYVNRNKSEHNMRLNLLTLWCCVTVGIYSHLMNLNFFILPFITLILIDKLKFKLKDNISLNGF